MMGYGFANIISNLRKEDIVSNQHLRKKLSLCCCYFEEAL